MAEKAFVVVASTRAAKGVYDDRTGPLIVTALQEWGFDVASVVVPDGKPVKEAGPGIPIQVLGAGGVPQAGDTFQAMEAERADEVAGRAALIDGLTGAEITYGELRMRDPEFVDAVASCRADQIVIDLVRLPLSGATMDGTRTTRGSRWAR